VNYEEKNKRGPFYETPCVFGDVLMTSHD